jgi:hypothetical protein
VITLILVPVFYSITILDLKLIRWESIHRSGELPAVSHT